MTIKLYLRYFIILTVTVIVFTNCQSDGLFIIEIDEESYAIDKTPIHRAFEDLNNKVFHFRFEDEHLMKYTVKEKDLYIEYGLGTPKHDYGKVKRAILKMYKIGPESYFMSYNTGGGYDSFVMNLKDSTFYTHLVILKHLIQTKGKITCFGDSTNCEQPKLFLAKDLPNN